MGTCSYCGSRFPLTRSTRKYCTPRCKTNPSRIRAADVRELYTLLEEDFSTVDTLRERLRRIIAPERPPIPQVTFGEEQDGVYVPKMD